jgi:hypothetical protein
MRKFGRQIFVLASTLLALGAGTARGHDLQGIVAERNSLGSEVWARIDEIRRLRRFLGNEAVRSQDAEIEAVVERELTWSDRRVSVCFLDGTQETRDHVAEVAQRWVESNSLQLDFACDTTNSSNIRVSFVALAFISFATARPCCTAFSAN